MRNSTAIVLALILLGLTFYLYEDTLHSTYPPGVLAPHEPSQTLLGAGPTWNKGKYHFTARADFSMRARVLSTERYWFDAASAVSPMDFAVGWGRLSDQAVLDRIGYGQTGRWYRYWPKGKEFPIPAGEIVEHSANMHMIPAGDEVLRTLRDVRRGDLISLEGYLVSVSGPGGWRWETSLSRTDSGNGACEIVWVKSLSIHRR